MPINSAFPISNQLGPEQGPKALRINVDLTLVNIFDFDLVKEEEADQLDFVQSIYVDNSLNFLPLTIDIQGIPQTLKIPALAQGVFPVFHSGAFRCRFSAAATMGFPIGIIFLNVPMAYSMWLPDQTYSFLKVRNDYVLPAVLTQQKFFTTPNGALTLAAGTYEFQWLYSMSGFPAGSSGKYSIKGAGSVILDNIQYAIKGVAQSNMTDATSEIMFANVDTTTVDFPQQLGSGVNRGIFDGSFEVITAGTIIPSFTSTAGLNIAILKGSYFIAQKVGAANVLGSGNAS